MVPSIFYTPTSVGLTRSPSFRARVGWMALTSLLESKSADIDSNFFRKVMKYRIHGTCARFGYSFLLFTPSLPTLVHSTASIVSTVSPLVSVTGVKVANTNISFLAFGHIWWCNVPSGDSCSTRFGRHLSPPSWWYWRWYPLQESNSYDPVFVGSLGTKNLFAGGPGPSGRRKSTKWKRTVSH